MKRSGQILSIFLIITLTLSNIGLPFTLHYFELKQTYQCGEQTRKQNRTLNNKSTEYEYNSIETTSILKSKKLRNKVCWIQDARVQYKAPNFEYIRNFISFC